jgi:hypothetical protein
MDGVVAGITTGNKAGLNQTALAGPNGQVLDGWKTKNVCKTDKRREEYTVWAVFGAITVVDAFHMGGEGGGNG